MKSTNLKLIALKNSTKPNQGESMNEISNAMHVIARDLYRVALFLKSHGKLTTKKDDERLKRLRDSIAHLHTGG
jgi:hypothetical protein